MTGTKPRLCSCMDCERRIIPYEPGKETPLLCPSCQDRADEAQRDHRIREAAHEMLAALEDLKNPSGCFCGRIARILHTQECQRAMAAIAKARGGPEC